MTSSSHLKWKSVSKRKMFRHDIFVSHSHYTKLNSFLSFFLTFKRKNGPVWRVFIYIHNIPQVLLCSNVPCTVGWPGTRGCIVQWSGHIQQGLLYSGVAVFDRIYCRVGWPCSTGFTVQWDDRVWQVLLYSRVAAYWYGLLYCRVVAHWQVYCTPYLRITWRDYRIRAVRVWWLRAVLSAHPRRTRLLSYRVCSSVGSMLRLQTQTLV